MCMSGFCSTCVCVVLCITALFLHFIILSYSLSLSLLIFVSCTEWNDDLRLLCVGYTNNKPSDFFWLNIHNALCVSFLRSLIEPYFVGKFFFLNNDENLMSEKNMFSCPTINPTSPKPQNIFFYLMWKPTLAYNKCKFFNFMF